MGGSARGAGRVSLKSGLAAGLSCVTAAQPAKDAATKNVATIGDKRFTSTPSFLEVATALSKDTGPVLRFVATPHVEKSETCGDYSASVRLRW
ncbi:MAG: hypothetical protein ACREF4_06530 [Gammaproteobacteria bacterium]